MPRVSNLRRAWTQTVVSWMVNLTCQCTLCRRADNNIKEFVSLFRSTKGVYYITEECTQSTSVSCKSRTHTSSAEPANYPTESISVPFFGLTLNVVFFLCSSSTVSCLSGRPTMHCSWFAACSRCSSGRWVKRSCTYSSPTRRGHYAPVEVSSVTHQFSLP